MIHRIITYMEMLINRGDTIASFHRWMLGNAKPSIQVQSLSDYGTYPCWSIVENVEFYRETFNCAQWYQIN